MKLPEFHKTGWFIIAPSKVGGRSLSWVRWIQFTFTHPTL